MYDMLRSQSCVNLPFNCKGCLRVLPKLTEMASQLNNQSKRYDLFVCLFDLILYVPSTIFQLYRDGSSWVEPVLS